ncbi:Sel1 domain protein repeat-containing protein [Methyloversatilis universalis FAM5]|jgi:TPR repeat protein|uniref:Sel1 domain protein repeat-containing protein n=1 Tax=Methyloversatilis universalis (strain ATCC BAA-1314 / DSM 25237 / JCM 13912 / CCUG 52030 / FAM5) TaxID=1000565 RepID=F5RET3_METUF|nr:tetratricopeptide repeat protein [Methyloversatilis universalis]EGK71414.1 Sel1 domain protein repeat-containing protein [Methyloversatilis universalis FAM5]
MSLIPSALPSLLAVVALGLPFAALAVTDEDIAEAVQKPSWGLYKGYAEFKMAHYADAKRIWSALAERGNGEAWFNLGILAEDGLGEPRDAHAARRLYENGAEAGSRNAALRLGLLLQGGKLGQRDLDGARRWLKVAADKGDAEAATHLAALDDPQGGGSVRDRELAEARRFEAEGRHADAAAMYRKLADFGDVRGVTRLAWAYEAGRGVERNLAEAARLFRVAAEQGDAEAQYALSVMLDTGAGQVRNGDEALRWLRASAGQNYPPAIQALQARN